MRPPVKPAPPEPELCDTCAGTGYYSIAANGECPDCMGYGYGPDTLAVILKLLDTHNEYRTVITSTDSISGIIVGYTAGYQVEIQTGRDVYHVLHYSSILEVW